jgi:hypothetical protein
MHTLFKDYYASAHISGVTQYKFIGMKNVSNECLREKIITLLSPIYFIHNPLLNVIDKCNTPCNFTSCLHHRPLMGRTPYSTNNNIKL